MIVVLHLLKILQNQSIVFLPKIEFYQRSYNFDERDVMEPKKELEDVRNRQISIDIIFLVCSY